MSKEEKAESEVTSAKSPFMQATTCNFYYHNGFSLSHCLLELPGTADNHLFCCKSRISQSNSSGTTAPDSPQLLLDSSTALREAFRVAPPYQASNSS